jgi:hypothetical protein
MKNKNDFFNNEYMPQMHKIGKITGYLGALLSFAPAIALAVVYGLVPDVKALLAAFGLAASTFGVLWFVEPLSYFTTVGPVGTYMAFLSGNISNMRLPCASMAQVAADVKPGTKEGSIISTLGMATSIIINITILTIGVILGSSVLSMLPAGVIEALNYLLPALFGALLVQFGMNQKGHACIILVYAILLNVAINAGIFNWLPGAANYLGILTSVFLSIVLAIVIYKKKAEE